MGTGRVVSIIFILFLSISGRSMAAAIGIPERKDEAEEITETEATQHTQFGVGMGLGFGFGYISMKDPDGPGESEWVVRPLNLIYTRYIGSRARLWSELFYQDAVLSPSPTEIGQHIKQFGVKASWQKPFYATRTSTSWLGLGLQLSKDRFENRHTADSTGYLLQLYPDRSEVKTALVLNYLFEMKIAGKNITGKLEKVAPAGDGLGELTLSVIFLFGR